MAKGREGLRSSERDCMCRIQVMVGEEKRAWDYQGLTAQICSATRKTEVLESSKL